MIFLNESIFENGSIKDGAAILIIRDSMYVDLLMVNDEENYEMEIEYDNENESEESIDLALFLKKNGYDLDELWSEGYNIYYGYIRAAIFQIEINLSLPS